MNLGFNQVILWFLDLEDAISAANDKSTSKELRDVQKDHAATFLNAAEAAINAIRQELELTYSTCICREPKPGAWHYLGEPFYCGGCGKARR